ncbi:MAG: hypothetical protein IPI63_05815 [Methanothrix sp.]|uniref:hypothetical protein n=1 Tax=Methanothrix sp. TaxID=90426 RepID=UPI0025ED77A8|nr:hypothetical protein [Methanothrix sp.]MBK7386255.1 hypothetical protein [Methanothrix sp.]
MIIRSDAQADCLQADCLYLWQAAKRATAWRMVSIAGVISIAWDFVPPGQARRPDSGRIKVDADVMAAEGKNRSLMGEITLQRIISMSSSSASSL